MSFADAFRVAIRAIAANGLRSILTTLGMVIGVGSVIVLIAVGQGAQKGVQDQIRGLGSNLIFIKPAAAPGAANQGARGAAGSGQTLTLADSDAIVESAIPGVAGVAPQISLDLQLISSTSNLQTTIIGTTPDYPAVRGVEVKEGVFLTAADVEKKALTIVLGPTVAQDLFPDGDAIGQSVRATFGPTNLTFKVAGVMTPKGGSGGGAQDAYAYIPLPTLQGRLSFQAAQGGRAGAPGGGGAQAVAAAAVTNVVVNQINIQATSNANQDNVIAAITSLLTQRHAVAEADFTIQSQEDLLGAVGEVSRTLSILLGSIAGISLVVGGIGVMNIMLVSVTERTREIGIRRAVGARARDIRLQFVTEALVLCLGGGLLGLAIGIGIALAIDGREIAGQNMSTVIQPWSAGVAFAVSAGIGLLSGSYPAFRASRLDPITALRNE